MAVFKRSAGIALAVVATALTLTGVVLSATDANPTSAAKDPLVLNGYPPKSANILVTISTGQSYSVSANVNVNFRTNAVEAVVHFPLVFSTTAVDVRDVNNRLYAEAADVSSGTWLSLALHVPALFGFSLELTKATDISLISGFSSETVTTSGYTTTYTFSRKDVALVNVLDPASHFSTLGSLTWSISVGSQGEVSASTLTMKTRTASTKLTAQILSYNQPANIVAPPARNVKKLKGSSIVKILTTTPLTTLLFPQSLTSLGQSHIN